MELIAGRADDMLIVRGINVYPTQVESVLLQVPELTPHYRLVVTREQTLDDVEVQVEVAESYLGAVGGGLDRSATQPLERRVEALIRDTIGASMRVTLLAPGEGPRSEGGKLARVDDRRRLA
jgi:phenylacetate-CoA ligase